MSIRNELEITGYIVLFLIVLVGLFSLMPDSEITDSQYVEITRTITRCPAALPELKVINKDHKILKSEEREFEDVVQKLETKDTDDQTAYDILVAKGLKKLGARKATCVPAPIISTKK